MSIWAIIPVKQLAQSKSRLAAVLSEAERARLVLQLLQRELDVLGQAACIDQTVVVSSDAAVLALAQAAGANVIPEVASEGINRAVQKAVGLAVQEGITAVLILPVDLPFLQLSDIEQIIDHAKTKQVGKTNMVICPDGHGTGTNALCLPPLFDFAFQYGEQSFQKHIAQARQHQLIPVVLQIPRLMFDLDTIDDWHTYQRQVAQLSP
ncbi:MAG: 2-phospho-L-lactate guanylyltransferase [Chloroflexota bacterium]